jgi:(2Fe-2S) ferredoxin
VKELALTPTVGQGLSFRHMGQYKHHVFVCTSGKTCSWQGGPEVHEAMKRAAHDAGLKGKVRINQSGCMNQCGHGPMVVVYPQDVWYGRVDEVGGVRIVNEHLVGGTPVDTYRYVAPPGDNKLE